MKKSHKIKIIICSILLVISIIAVLFSAIKPFEKYKIVYDGPSTQYILKSGKTYKSKFNVDRDNLIGLIFYINCDNDYDGKIDYNIELKISIYDSDNNLFYENTFTRLNEDRNYLLFKDKKMNSGKYKIVLENIKSGKDLPIEINSFNNLRLSTIGTTANYMFLYIFLGIFIIIAMILTYLIQKNISIKPIKNKIIKLVVLIGYFLLSASMSIVMLLIYYFYVEISKGKIYLIIILMLLLLAVMFIGMNIIKNNKRKIAVYFLTVAIPISLVFCFAFLPNDGQDGYRHFGTAYSYASGVGIKTENPDVPDIINTGWGGFLNVDQLVQKLKIDYDYSNVKPMVLIGYHPLLYSFSIPGMFIGKTLNLNPYILWYIGKLFNIIGTLIAGYFIIKRTPKFKSLFLTFMLLPMCIYQYVTLSADLMINIATLGLIAICLDIYFNNKKVNLKDSILITLCSFIMIIGKIVYFPVVIALLFMIRKQIKKDYKKILILLIFMILGILHYRILLKNGTQTAITFTTYNSQNLGISYLMHNPISAIDQFIRQIFREPDENFLNFIGRRYSWAGGEIPYACAAIYLMILCFATFIPDKIKNKNKIDRKTIISFILSIIIVSAFMILFFASTYGSTNYFNYELEGVQGRYFVPLLILAFISLTNFKLFDVNQNKVQKFEVANIIMILGIQYIYLYYILNLL